MENRSSRPIPERMGQLAKGNLGDALGEGFNPTDPKSGFGGIFGA